MRQPARNRPRPARGAALLQAMLTVTLVATFAAAALWQQWRSVEIEAAERARVQSSWILVGAVDWARLLLRLDGQASPGGVGVDHLGEPWAVPLAESRLSTFLAADRNNTGGQTNEEALDAFLSGQIGDLQARMNLRNLVDSSRSEVWYDAFARLFKQLGLPTAELSVLTDNLQRAWGGLDADSGTAPIAPQRVAQLVNYGLSAPVLAALEPYVMLLSAEGKTPININTASAVVLAAAEPLLTLADAERLVAARASQFFRQVGDAGKVLGKTTPLFADGRFGVSSSYFEVRGRLRLESITLEERSVVQRKTIGPNSTVVTLSRERLSYDERLPGPGGIGAAARP